MDRKSVAVVTFAAVLLTIAMSSLVAPPRGGVAIRAAAPGPPHVGSCGDFNGAELVFTDCALSHTVEVVFAWSAADSAAGPRPSFGGCADKVRSYVGSAPSQDSQAHAKGRWSLPLRYRPVLATGPGGSNLRDWSWQACLVAPLGPAPWSGYQGRVRGIPATGPTSASLRACYSDPGSALTVVPCSLPHSGEILATQPLPTDAPVANLSAAGPLQTTCEATARWTTGAADPSFQGQLRVAVLTDRDAGRGFSADIGVYYTSAGLNWLLCVVESANDRKLIDSVAGIGTARLPFG